MDGFSPLATNLFFAFLVLILVILWLVTILVLLRRRRQNAQFNLLPLHADEHNDHKRSIHRRRPALVIAPPAFDHQSKFDFVRESKLDPLKHSHSPPSSPVPQIRITFPEEVSEDGKRQSGRVVIVRVGENGIGLEPVEDNLPAYQEVQKDELQSVELNHIGGLKDY